MSHPSSPAVGLGLHASREPQSSNYKWKVLSVSIFSFFMIVLDVTVINVAFPVLRQDFGGSLDEAQWIISVYVMAMGISMPLTGFLSDRFGSKRVYLVGLGVFAFGSLLCGLSTSLYMLIVCRALQGFGGGVVMPLGNALLLQAFPVEEQGAALGVFGIAGLVAPALGPLLGGWLVSLNLWRVIFFVNPPIGLLGIVLGMRFLRDDRRDQCPPLDVLGFITSTIGFGGMLYAASIAADSGWTAPVALTWFVIGGAGLIAFAFVELFVAKAPLMDLRLFRNRIFLNASVLGYVATWALFGAEFLLPVYLQTLRGRSPLETGIILLPMAVTGGIFSMTCGRIYDRIGPRLLMVIGFGILMVNTWQLAQLRADTPIHWILFLLALRGMALGLTAQTTMATAMSAVPPRDLPRGSSLSNSTRQVVQSIGVAVLTTILVSTLSPEVAALQNTSASQAGLCDVTPTASTSNLNTGSGTVLDTTPIPSGQSQVVLPESLRERSCQEYVSGFERTYTVTFYAALAAMILGIFLPGWPAQWHGRKAAGPPAI